MYKNNTERLNTCINKLFLVFMVNVYSVGCLVGVLFVRVVQSLSFFVAICLPFDLRLLITFWHLQTFLVLISGDSVYMMTLPYTIIFLIPPFL